MKQKLLVVPAICTIPVGESSDFKGIIDLIDFKFVLKDDTDKTNRKYSLVDIPAAFQEVAHKYREQLLETASLADDHMAELILDGKDVPKDMLLKALRAGTLQGKFTPIYCGSSKNFHGVQILLDAVVNFLPSPLDRPPVEGFNPKSKEKEKLVPRPRKRSLFRVWLSRRWPIPAATWYTFASILANFIRPTRSSTRRTTRKSASPGSTG